MYRRRGLCQLSARTFLQQLAAIHTASPSTHTLGAHTPLTSRVNTPLVALIVPTYKEAENLPVLAQRLHDVRARMPGLIVIVVDDNSRDGSVEAIERLRADRGWGWLHIHVRTTERGLSSAVISGFRLALSDRERFGPTPDVLAVMDADLSHPPEALPDMVEVLTRPANTADFVIGSRYVRGGTIDRSWTLFRHLNSKVATWLARPIVSISDPMSGYFAAPAPLVARCLAHTDARGLSPIGFKIGLEVLIKAGCRRPHEVPIHFADRVRGQSKLGLKEQARYLRHLAGLYGFVLTGGRAKSRG